MSKIDYTCASCAQAKICKFQEAFQEIYSREQDGDLLIVEIPEFLIIRCKYYRKEEHE